MDLYMVAYFAPYMHDNVCQHANNYDNMKHNIGDVDMHLFYVNIPCKKYIF